MARFLWVVVGIPAGIVLIALGVANRAPVTISLDPFRPDTAALSMHPPLFLAFFAVLAVGVILGGAAVWLSQLKVRRALHRAREEAARLRQEREQLLAERGPSQPALPSPASRRAA
ncbi:MAG: LapA family protein [Ancalomicrobiaceae bacterium]|nr:LapA family protein [Ancalomicrobiaceae bacterium]